jgi:hypothetical protein
VRIVAGEVGDEPFKTGIVPDEQQRLALVRRGTDTIEQ